MRSEERFKQLYPEIRELEEFRARDLAEGSNPNVEAVSTTLVKLIKRYREFPVEVKSQNNNVSVYRVTDREKLESSIRDWMRKNSGKKRQRPGSIRTVSPEPGSETA